MSELNGIPVSGAQEAPPEVLEAFLRFAREHPSLFQGKSLDPSRLRLAPRHVTFRCIACQEPVLSGLETCPSCGTSTRQSLKGGDLLQGRYRIGERLVATGGFGALYVCEDLQEPGVPLVVKQLQHGRGGRDKDRELFLREGELLRMMDHHALPRFHDAFERQGALYLVMERIPGVTLGQWLRAKGAMNEAQVQALLPQMLEVLSYMHHRPVPIVHRDVKPGNFMLSPDGHLTLVDLGGATSPTPSEREPEANGLPRDLTSVLTRGFTAPEILLGGTAVPASDLFSMGVTCLFLLSGKHPFTRYEPVSGTYRLDDLNLSEALKPILRKLVAWPLGDRYGDAEDVLADLLTAGIIRPMQAPGA
ncbi:MAG: serine/threonine-protein kinase [bacterium]|nr:serine/threonine-protein kinase [bacterium]